jgi:hypothetical protein
VSARAWRTKAAVLLFAGGLAVHELRYLVAYGAGAQRAEANQGHAYLAMLSPLVATAAALALAAWLIRMLGGRPGPEARAPGLRFSRLWAGASGLLLGLYALQETLEGVFAAGHPDGIAGVFGHGGWTAVVLALAVGAVLALLLRAADVPLGAPASAPRLWWPAPVSAAVARREPASPKLTPLAHHLAGRGPPPTSV